jgi:hypothetical protein
MNFGNLINQSFREYKNDWSESSKKALKCELNMTRRK